MNQQADTQASDLATEWVLVTGAITLDTMMRGFPSLDDKVEDKPTMQSASLESASISAPFCSRPLLDRPEELELAKRIDEKQSSAFGTRAHQGHGILRRASWPQARRFKMRCIRAGRHSGFERFIVSGCG